MPDENRQPNIERLRDATVTYVPAAARAQLAVEIRLASPLYGGGVEAGRLDTITPFRSSGIRGGLRFWWRATKGASFENFEDLREAEAEIWGDREQESNVRVDIQTPSDWSDKRVHLRAYERDLNRRYALFPPYNKKGVNLDEPKEDFLGSGSFRLTLGLADRKYRDDVEAALWAWVNFGGIGARTRRGAGALFCHAYAGLSDKYVQGDGKLRDWPTLKGGSIVWGPAKRGARAWDDAWIEVLGLYREFRQDRQGRGPTGWPEPSEIRALRLGPRKAQPEGFPRGALGLPIVFHFKKTTRIEPNDQTLGIKRPGQTEAGRMASPVIIKPLIMAPDLAYPIVLVLNTAEPPTLHLFEKSKSEPVEMGRRDAIAELLLRAQRRWGGSVVPL